MDELLSFMQSFVGRTRTQCTNNVGLTHAKGDVVICLGCVETCSFTVPGSGQPRFGAWTLSCGYQVTISQRRQVQFEMYCSLIGVV